MPQGKVDVQRRMLTTAEAARYCGLSVSYLKVLRCSGSNGPAVTRIGRKLRLYAIEDLDSWLGQYRKGAAAAAQKATE